MKWPFRYRYWLVREHGNLVVSRARRNPSCWAYYRDLLDGPFDRQEDVVHALNFWRL